MRESQTKKIPLTIIVGDSEVSNNSVSYRLFGSKDTTSLEINEFISKIKDVITNKKNNID